MNLETWTVHLQIMIVNALNDSWTVFEHFRSIITLILLELFMNLKFMNCSLPEHEVQMRHWNYVEINSWTVLERESSWTSQEMGISLLSFYNSWTVLEYFRNVTTLILFELFMNFEVHELFKNSLKKKSHG